MDKLLSDISPLIHFFLCKTIPQTPKKIQIEQFQFLKLFKQISFSTKTRKIRLPKTLVVKI